MIRKVVEGIIGLVVAAAMVFEIYVQDGTTGVIKFAGVALSFYGFLSWLKWRDRF
jgi:hypothetical protein